MRRLNVSVPVKAPSDFTFAFVWAYFRERAQGGKSGRLTLQLPLRGAATTVSLGTSVAIDVTFAPEGAGETGALQIAWRPEGRTRFFPSFRGALTTQIVRNADCVLALSGAYVPPGGLLGAVFDTIIGVRIARATIERFLEQLGVSAEADYHTRLAL